MKTRQEQIKEGIGDWFKEKNPIDTIQNYADFVGMVPGIGNVVDIGSALVDVAQGQYGDAAVRGTQAIPYVGIPAALVGGGIKSLLQQPDASTTPEAVLKAGKDKTGKDKKDKSTKAPETPRSLSPEQLNRVMGAMYNTREISRPAIPTFADSLEVTSAEIAKLLNEGAWGVLSKAFGKGGKKGAGKVGGEMDEFAKLSTQQQQKLLAGLGKKGVLSGGALPTWALAAGAISLPFGIGKLLGGGGPEYTGGQALVPGGGVAGAASGVGGAGVMDRLQALSGFVPGFSPAGTALTALGKRVGRVA